jgi:alpha-L-rhamnosidase
MTKYAALLLFLLPQDSSPVVVTKLRCEYLTNPIGIDVAQPRLSWVMESPRRGEKQTAYQIVVEGAWDSGKIESDQSTHVVYGGPAVARAVWKVRVWDKDGKPSAWSEPAFWESGPSEWKAKWIALLPPKPKTSVLEGAKWIWTGDASKGRRYFRKSFAIDRPVKKAVAAITADDQFELYLNGKSIGKSSGEAEAWRQVQLFNLELAQGENVIGIKGNNTAEGPAGVLARLAVEFESGDPLAIVTDRNWKCVDELVAGWHKSGCDDKEWAGATEVQGPGPVDDRNVVSSQPQPSPLLRKSFTLSAVPKRARVYVTALGLYELRINGRRVGRDCLSPEWTDYTKRVQYQAYDVTGFLRPGENVIGAMLGDGWFAGQVAWIQRGKTGYGLSVPRLLVQLHADDQIVATDETWKATRGPITYSDLLGGETYDARLEQEGWDKAGFEDASWQAASVIEDGKKRAMVAQLSERVQVTQQLKPVSVKEIQPGAFLFDMGQNMVGWVRIRAKAPAGTEVKIRHAEILTPEGALYTENLRTAKATDRYIFKGSGEEVFEPRFTFHGFRYVEVSGVKPEEIVGCVAHSAMPRTGTFECSNDWINKLQSNIVWGQRGNFVSIPTDCPQRDERLGWMGDAQVFVRTGSYNYETAAFFTKWMVDVEDGQTPDGAFADVSPRVPTLPADGAPAWGDAGVIVPWTMYEVYGDTRILSRHYSAMARWVEHISKNNPNHLWIKRTGNNYGDWIPPFPFTKGEGKTIKDACATAWYANSVRLMGKIATALGKSDDAKMYWDLFEKITAAFNAAYVREDGRIKGDWQTCYVLALRFELLPVEKRAAAAKHLVADIMEKRGGHLSVGFMGAPHLMPVLTEAGYVDVNYKLLLNDDYPSWIYPIKEGGATTIWERWDGWKDGKFQNPSMNSFNHYAYGSVGEWIYSTVAGIDLAAPGYKKIVIRPRPGGGMMWARGEYESMYGKIASSWKWDGEKLTLDVVIPANTTATVWVPGKKASERTGEGVQFLRAEAGCQVFQLGSGSYRFVGE